MLYDAALGRLDWTAALGWLAQVSESDACLIAWTDRRRGRVGIVVQVGLGPEIPAEFADPLLVQTLARAPDAAGQGWQAVRWTAPGRDRGHPPRGHPPIGATPEIVWSHACARVVEAEALVIHVVLLRRPGREPFDPDRLAGLAPVLAHLQRAWLIRGLLRRSGLASLDAGGVSADDLLGGAPDEQADERPASGSGTTCNGAPGRVLRSGNSAVPDYEPARKLCRDGRPLQPAGGNPGVGSGSRHAAGPHFPWQQTAVRAIPLFENAGTELRLRLLYKLTPAEARLADQLARGSSLQDVADRLDVSVATVRTHLSRIYDKTGTNRQSELVALLLRGPAQLHVD